MDRRRIVFLSLIQTELLFTVRFCSTNSEKINVYFTVGVRYADRASQMYKHLFVQRGDFPFQLCLNHACYFISQHFSVFHRLLVNFCHS